VFCAVMRHVGPILYIQRRSTMLLILGCYWPCRNPCLFEVELATNILSLYIYTLKRVWNTHPR
jgi:hypothetical protein